MPPASATGGAPKLVPETPLPPAGPQHPLQGWGGMSQWSFDALKEKLPPGLNLHMDPDAILHNYTQAMIRDRAQGGNPIWERDARATFEAPQQVSVAPPPVYDPRMLMAEQPDAVRSMTERLRKRFEQVPPEQRASDPFWREFQHSPELQAARMLSSVFSNLSMPDRGREQFPMSPGQQQYLQEHPLQRWFDWIRYSPRTNGWSQR